MKPSSILINTAKGDIVRKENVIYVFETKKYAKKHSMYVKKLPESLGLLIETNFLCRPHVSGSSVKVNLAMERATINGSNS